MTSEIVIEKGSHAGSRVLLCKSLGMNWTLRKPCNDCPFLKKGGIRLHPARATEIMDAVTTNPGATFACHKTTVDDDSEGDRVVTMNSQHCAGALVFAEKQGLIDQPQMNRIAMRLSLFDPSKLQGHKQVFDSQEEMLDAQIPQQRAKRRARLRA